MGRNIRIARQPFASPIELAVMPAELHHELFGRTTLSSSGKSCAVTKAAASDSGKSAKKHEAISQLSPDRITGKPEMTARNFRIDDNWPIMCRYNGHVSQELNRPANLRLSVQRSLIGNVTANLAGLRAELRSETILIDAYFFAAPSEEDRELIDDAAAEVIADYPDGYMIETYLGTLSEIDVKGKTWDFLRSEASRLNVLGE